MPDNQPMAITPGLWQTTLSENTTATQRRLNIPVATPEQPTKEKTPQVEKSRSTRQMGTAPLTSSTKGDIPDVATGHSWLDARGLLAPSGTTPMLVTLAEALFQVRALPNTPLQTLNRIHAVASMLQELELVNMAKEVANMVSKKLTSLIDGMQYLIKEKTEEVATKLHEKTNKIITQAKDTIIEIGTGHCINSCSD